MKQCLWNHMDHTICSGDRVSGSAWCSTHKEQADKVWDHEDERSKAYKEKEKIPTIQPLEKYL